MKTNIYRKRPASAFVRGWFETATNGQKAFRQKYPELFEKQIFELTEENMDELIRVGESYELSLHIFRANIQFGVYEKVISILKGIQPDNILDVGSQRGAFLWQLTDTFRYTSVTSVELNQRYINWMKMVQRGGITHLKPICGDAKDLSTFLVHEFDTITALNVLDYSENYKKILNEICRLAKRFIIISIAYGRNDNPRHFYRFNEEDIRRAFQENNIFQVKIEKVQNHLIAVARK